MPPPVPPLTPRDDDLVVSDVDAVREHSTVSAGVVFQVSPASARTHLDDAKVVAVGVRIANSSAGGDVHVAGVVVEGNHSWLVQAQLRKVHAPKQRRNVAGLQVQDVHPMAGPIRNVDVVPLASEVQRVNKVAEFLTSEKRVADDSFARYDVDSSLEVGPVIVVPARAHDQSVVAKLNHSAVAPLRLDLRVDLQVRPVDAEERDVGLVLHRDHYHSIRQLHQGPRGLPDVHRVFQPVEVLQGRHLDHLLAVVGHEDLSFLGDDDGGDEGVSVLFDGGRGHCEPQVRGHVFCTECRT